MKLQLVVHVSEVLFFSFSFFNIFGPMDSLLFNDLLKIQPYESMLFFCETN